MSKASRRRWRAFGSAFMLTLCLLILGAGLPGGGIQHPAHRCLGDACIQMDYRIQDGRTIRTPLPKRDTPRPAGRRTAGRPGRCCPPARRRLVY